MLPASLDIAYQELPVAVGAPAVRLSNAVGAAFTNRRVLQPVEARLILVTGLLLLGIAVFLYFFPRVAGYVLLATFGWIGIALIYRASKLYRKRKRP